jgi:hypothetical protein
MKKGTGIFSLSKTAIRISITQKRMAPKKMMLFIYRPVRKSKGVSERRESSTFAPLPKFD